MTRAHLIWLAAITAGLGTSASAQNTIKIGNEYRA